MNADRILPGLWQGGVPPRGDELRRRGFDVVVLCAGEVQPEDTDFPGVEVWRVPFYDYPDRPLPKNTLSTICAMATRVAWALWAGRRVLVTCAMGLNRSGLVTSLALHILMGWHGRACISWVRGRRRGSMGNPVFNRILATLGTASGLRGTAVSGVVPVAGAAGRTPSGPG